jgi:glucose-6-phosphate 1-dehydrogenase
VQITAAETIGVEGRWAFYDVAGALRDMVQNHLLQLLCLVAMEPPARLEAGFVRDEKLKVLHSLKPVTGAEIRERTVRGQYRSGAVHGQVVPGYTEEQDGAESDTETFVAVKAEIMNWRWAGVPFYLRTGKRLARRFSEIVIQFREVAHPLFGDSGMPNRLIIRLQPDEGIQLRLMNKIPGLEADMPLQEVALNLSYSEAFSGKAGVDAYERLLLDAIKGNPTLFVRADEVEAAWAWIDHIAEGWRASRYRPEPYVAGSYGPPEAVAMLARDGRSWYDVE